jgi:serine/threonine-protein kinase HipA
MKAKTKTLYVFYGEVRVGTLSVEANHQYRFAYDTQWLSSDTVFALSCSLPLSESLLPYDASYAFFSNLIPEGDLRNKLAMQLGISEKNDFGLLEIVGGDVAGAISLYPDENIPETGSNEAKQLNETDLLYVLEKLKTHPFLANTEDFNEGKALRLSLAGAQNKLPIIYQDQCFALPLGQTASSHILKPDNEYIPNLVINEAFCMKLAKACGLPVADVELRHIQDQTILLIERYDREKGKRLHQEDFCQALGIVPFNKYENEGGPGFAACREVIEQHSQRPAADKKTLLQWALFNFLIGNADAHGKNISLLYQHNNSNPVLAPFYDLICTAIYPSLSDRLSMKIGGENRPEWIMKRHWQRFCETLGVSEKMLQREAKRLVFSILNEAKQLSKDKLFADYANEPLTELLNLIDKRSARLLERVAESA